MKRNTTALLAALMLALTTGCSSAKVEAENAETAAPAAEAAAVSETAVNNTETETVKETETEEESSDSEYFTSRDMEQTPDLSDAVTYTVTDGQDITISEEGVYVLNGSASEVTVIVDAADEDKVQIVLDGVKITNTDSPAIYVKNADKVFVTSTSDSNELSVTGTFTADGDTNTDAVIFSKDDLVINGTGTVTISSTDNGITSKDDLKITGGTWSVTASSKAFEANDSIRVADGTLNITAGTDGLHAENDEDDTVGYIYIAGGDINIKAGDDGIHATTTIDIDGGTMDISGAEGIEATVITINDGTINISASDDGINASAKSTAYSPAITINGGYITITMGSGDTDAVDSNGSITVNGGTLDITAQSPFDYVGQAQYNGGTIIVNGETVNAITNQMMGGGMMGGMEGQMPGGTEGQTGQMPSGEMPSGQMPSGGMSGGPGMR